VSGRRRLACVLAALALACGARAERPPAGATERLGPGDHEVGLRHDGRERSYRIHLPPASASGDALPVVLSFHGGASNPRGQQRYTRMDALADREGFAVVYPAGTGRRERQRRFLTWNAGACCGPAQRGGVDDVGFVAALLDDLPLRAPVDARRIYATGMSNGAMLAQRVAAELSDRIAAVAPVAGALSIGRIPEGRAMPVLHIHSVDDHRALYAGGLGPASPVTGARSAHTAVEVSLRRWVEHDGCAPEPGVEARREGRGRDAGHTATRLRWSGCREGSEVVHWRLTGAGHVWPGGDRDRLERVLGPGTGVIDANVEMWTFFQRFVRSAPGH